MKNSQFLKKIYISEYNSIAMIKEMMALIVR